MKGYMNSSEPWKNHSMHVSYVNKATNDFALITGIETDSIISSAAQNYCEK